MINDKNSFVFLIGTKKHMLWIFVRIASCGYLLESSQQGDSKKYSQHMFLGVLNTVFLNIS